MSEQTLDSLHTELAKELLRRVKSGEATASELSVAAKFLKDNDVIVDDAGVPGSPTGELAQGISQLPFPVQ